MPNTQDIKNDAFDFDYWKELYESDPVAFEAKREELLKHEIAKSPEHLQRRLKGIQFELDAKRRLCDSPLESCMQMSSQMWDSFDLMRTNLNALARPEALTEEEMLQLQKPAESATVLRFEPTTH